MSDKEKFGFRDLSYSAFHRPDSFARFVPREITDAMAMIDIDYVLWAESEIVGERGKWPVALIEAAMDNGTEYPHKICSLTTSMAILADLPALCVLYTKSGQPNPFQPSVEDISGFRVRRLYPKPEHRFRTMSPEDFCRELCGVRDCGLCRVEKRLKELKERQEQNVQTSFA